MLKNNKKKVTSSLAVLILIQPPLQTLATIEATTLTSSPQNLLADIQQSAQQQNDTNTSQTTDIQAQTIQSNNSTTPNSETTSSEVQDNSSSSDVLPNEDNNSTRSDVLPNENNNASSSDALPNEDNNSTSSDVLPNENNNSSSSDVLPNENNNSATSDELLNQLPDTDLPSVPEVKDDGVISQPITNNETEPSQIMLLASSCNDYYLMTIQQKKDHITKEINDTFTQLNKLQQDVFYKLMALSVNYNYNYVELRTQYSKLTFELDYLKFEVSRLTDEMYIDMDHTSVLSKIPQCISDWTNYLNNVYLKAILNNELTNYATEINNYISQVNIEAADLNVDGTDTINKLNALLPFTVNNMNKTGNDVYTVLDALVHTEKQTFKTIQTEWRNVASYISTLKQELDPFTIEVSHFEQQLQADYNDINPLVEEGWLNAIDAQYTEASSALAQTKTFIETNKALTNEQAAKTALSTLKSTIQPNFESALISWNNTIAETKKGLPLAQKLKDLQLELVAFNTQLEQQYALLQDEENAKPLYDAARSANQMAQQFINDNKLLIGTEAENAETLYPSLYDNYSRAKLNWNKWIETILSDSPLTIVNDFGSWSNEYATTLPLQQVSTIITNGLTNNSQGSVIIADLRHVVPQSSNDTNFSTLSALVSRAVLWHKLNADQTEFANDIQHAIMNSENNLIYQDLKVEKDKIEQLIAINTAGQLDAELVTALQDELTKIENAIHDLSPQTTSIIKPQVPQIRQEVEQLTIRVVNYEEIKQLNAINSYIDEVLSYIDSAQTQNELLAYQTQIQTILASMTTLTHEEVVTQVNALKTTVDASITAAFQAMYDDLSQQYAALDLKTSKELEQLNACDKTQTGVDFTAQMKENLKTLQAQLEMIHHLMENKNFSEFHLGKETFISQAISNNKYIDELSQSSELCRPITILKTLTISNGSLTPEFNSDVYTYTVDVFDISSILISGEALDHNAAIFGLGSYPLTLGENRIEIKVKNRNAESQYVINITADSIEAIVNELETWANQNATTLPLDVLAELIANGLLNNDSSAIIMDEMSQVIVNASGNTNLENISHLVSRAVLWYKLNPDKPELINTIKAAILNAENYLTYQDLMVEKEKVNQLLLMSESSQMDATLVTALQDELTKIVTLINDLAGQNSAAVKPQVPQIRQEVEQLTIRVVNYEEIKQLNALNSYIDEVLSYIDSAQTQNELLAYQTQIQNLLENMQTISHEQLVTEVSAIKSNVDASITAALQAEYDSLLNQYTMLESKTNVELERLNGCQLTQNGSLFSQQLTVNINALNTQLLSLQNLMEAKNLPKFYSMKQLYLTQVASNTTYLDENAQDTELCRPIIAKLGSLNVSQGVLTPQFNSDIYAYSLNVLYDVTSIDVSGQPSDSSAKVIGLGSYLLNVGENRIEIKVTNKEVESTYIITVFRAEEEIKIPEKEPNHNNEVKSQPEIKSTAVRFPQTGINALASIISGTGLLGLGTSIIIAIKRRKH